MSDRRECREWIERADSLAEFVDVADEHGVSADMQTRALLQHVWGEDVPSDRAGRVLRRERRRLDDSDRVSLSVSGRAPRYMDLQDLKLLSGYEFEHVLAEILRRVEGDATVTEAPGTRGVDVVWERDDRTVGIRARAHDLDDPVGNGAVQEVHAGATTTEPDYSIDIPAVVTTSRYTDGAREAAEASSVRLYGSSHLERWLSDAELDAEAVGEILETV